jgi:hypothetical protein
MNTPICEFMECIPCAATNGHPYLCGPCLHNRATIEALKFALTRRSRAETSVENGKKMGRPKKR